PWGTSNCTHQVQLSRYEGDLRVTNRFALCTDVLEFFANYGQLFDITNYNFKDALLYPYWIKFRGTGDVDLDGNGYPGKLWVCKKVENGECKYINPHDGFGKTGPMVAIKKIAPYQVRLLGRSVPVGQLIADWKQHLPDAQTLADFQLNG